MPKTTGLIEAQARSTAEKVAIAKAAGAQEVIGYRGTDTAAAVPELTGGTGADPIVDVDFGANRRVNAAAIAANGVIGNIVVDIG